MPDDPKHEWERQLDELGVEVVRLRLLRGKGSGPGAEFRLEHGPHPSRGDVEDWLRRKERQAEDRHRWRFIWIIAVGVAGLFVPILIALLG